MPARRLPVRTDARYSAALTLRFFQRMRRLDSRLFPTHASIRAVVRRDPALCWQNTSRHEAKNGPVETPRPF